MKKFYLTLSLIALASFSIIGCSDNPEKYSIDEIEDYNFKHIPVTEVGTGNYLYEIYNDDYETRYYFNPLSMSSEFNGVKQWHGVCGGVRNGDIFGRNLDWSCGESPEFIVHTPAKNGRHATLGICTSHLVSKMLDKDQKWISQMMVNDITLNCFDGINDAGVCMVLLVVHYSDGLKKGEKEITGTNPSAKKTIHGTNMLRYVLDNANSAAHGVELMKSVNTYGTLEHYTFHWMLCDEKDNYFVEIMGNELKVTKAEENPIEKFRKPIITNFYLQKDTVDQVVPGGTERYDILNEHYDNASTVSGMFDILEKIRFSRKYDGMDPKEAKKLGLPDKNWYSEFYSYMPDLDTFEQVYHDKYSDRQQLWDTMISKDIERNALWNFANPRTNALSSWTCHSSVYNIKDRTMQVVTGEQYNKILPSATTTFKIGK